MRRFGHRHGCRAGLLRQSFESLGTSRVSYENLMAERAEAPSERAADVARANDANIHLCSFSKRLVDCQRLRACCATADRGGEPAAGDRLITTIDGFVIATGPDHMECVGRA